MTVLLVIYDKVMLVIEECVSSKNELFTKDSANLEGCPMANGSEFQNQDAQPEKAPENHAIDGLRMTPFKIALIFAVAGILWIGFTDLLVSRYFGEDTLLAQSLKGGLFVVATTTLVYWLARRAYLEVNCKYAEKQHKETQNLLEKTLACLGDAVFLINPTDRTILQCNPAAERLFGYASEEMVGRNTLFLYEQPKDYENFGHDSEIVLDLGETFRGEFHMQTKDGTLIQTEHTITAINEELGWRDGVISIVHDITERKKAIEASRESEAYYRTLVETIPDLVWLKDTQGVYLGCNRVFERLFGAKEEEIIGKTDYDFIDGGQADSFRENDRRALEIGGPSINEEWLTFAEGGYSGHFETIKTPMRNAKGEIVGILGVARDITARKEADNSLRQSEEKFRALFEYSPEAVFLTTTDGRIEAANPAACNMFGWSEQEFPKMTRSSVLDKDDPRLAKGLEERRRTGLVRNLELTAISKDGTHFPVEVDSVIFSQDGKQSFVIMRDIRRRKQEEQARLELERQLHQAQKIESIGQLAGGVAHDFNNMLGVILGHAEMALMKADPSSPLISDLEEIGTAANRSADLTRQLLTFARKQVIAPKVLDLNEVVAGTLKMLQRLIGENIQLSWIPAANLWPVKIDPSQLDQILANLCVNARDAIAGIGKISIKTENRTIDKSTTSALPYDVVPGDYVRLSVSDDGCGMDKQVQAHIFEPFYTTKEVGSGTGLGLATVYGAVKQNHGFLTVYSEPGLGAVFNIYLPRTSNAVEAKQEAVEKPILRGTETVLLVEDDEMVLRMVTTMLEESGYTVLSAATTKLAQSFAREHSGPIHLLISDMIMPAMNGRELSIRLQALRPEMKVLFLSGYTAEIITKQGVIKDGAHFLQKPFSLEALTAKVRQVLDDH